MRGPQQYPDFRDGSVPQVPSSPKISHGERRERKLLFFYGLGCAMALGFALAEASAVTRRLILAFYVIAASLLLLMARYIVHSYKREKGRLNPYDCDHIVK